MPDRLAKLLAKSKARKLSSAETEELAGLLNAPLLENQTTTFVSKHKLTATDAPARVNAIDWFSNCGKPSDFDVTMKSERVASWAQAMKASKSQSWHYVTMEARNQLTMALHHIDKDRYQSWNEITVAFKKKVITPLTKKVWEPFQKEHGLDVRLVHSLQWNVLAALMENAYIDCKHGSYFFLELLTIYEAGRLPTGWRGSWPTGALIVY